MPGGDPMAGTFHQMQVTVGNTACSVKGILVFGNENIFVVMTC